MEKKIRMNKFTVLLKNIINLFPIYFFVIILYLI